MTVDLWRPPQAAPPKRKTRLSVMVDNTRHVASRKLHNFRNRNDPRLQRPKIVVIIPAHNEEEALPRTIAAWQAQSVRVDRIVIMNDRSADATAAVAMAHGVTVIDTVSNHHGKTGGLNQAYDKLRDDGYSYFVGADADTAPAPDCLGHLLTEIRSNPQIGGVMARYTFEANGSLLVDLQRAEFSNWQSDLLARKDRTTYVLGGQTSILSAGALKAVAELNHGQAWSTKTDVEDMALTGDMRSLGYMTLVSTTARAYADPMPSLKTLWHQRRKWDAGMVRLLMSNGLNKWTRTLWKQQLSLFANGLTRLAFLVLLIAAVMVSKFDWSWWWAIPPGMAVVLNFRNAMRVPHRRTRDILMGVTLIPVEFYLIFRVLCATASWFEVISGQHRDGWAAQHAAESGKKGSSAGPFKFFLGGAALAGLVYGIIDGWRHLPGSMQNTTLLTSWHVLAGITVIQVLFMAWRIIRPTHGLKP